VALANRPSTDDEATRIERAIGKIGNILGQQVSMESIKHELAGMIEAITEN
jgi:hypothetical protein